VAHHVPWLATFADPLRAQSAIDRLTGNAYDLLVEGESYRQRLKPSAQQPRSSARQRAGAKAANAESQAQ